MFWVADPGDLRYFVFIGINRIEGIVFFIDADTALPVFAKVGSDVE
jgi:hypothetical protein